jgi:hypothetical protein
VAIHPDAPQQFVVTNYSSRCSQQSARSSELLRAITPTADGLPEFSHLVKGTAIPTNIHGIGNAFEAAVWWVLGVCVLTAALRQTGQRRNIVIVGVILILFGVSDVVEISTGAWWRPWWLFVWKAFCVLILCWQWYAYRKRRSAFRMSPDPKGS